MTAVGDSGQCAHRVEGWGANTAGGLVAGESETSVLRAHATDT